MKSLILIGLLSTLGACATWSEEFARGWDEQMAKSYARTPEQNMAITQFLWNAGEQEKRDARIEFAPIRQPSQQCTPYRDFYGNITDCR